MLEKRKKVLAIFIVSLCAMQFLFLYRAMPQFPHQKVTRHAKHSVSSIKEFPVTIARSSYPLERALEKPVHSGLAGGAREETLSTSAAMEMSQRIGTYDKTKSVTTVVEHMEGRTLDRTSSRSTSQSDNKSEELPSRDASPCLDDWCTSYLQKSSFLCYELCNTIAEIEMSRKSTDIPKRCKFRRVDGHDPVALVSVPGSGNTWVRGLLEKATGVCTGSIYCDAPLRFKGFVGENVHDGSVLVIKTHTSDFQWRGTRLENRNILDTLYGAAILLIRNPFDTFVAERHRSILKEKAQKRIFSHEIEGPDNDKSHWEKVGEKAFVGSDWNDFVNNITTRWKKTVVKWLTSGHSVLVVCYEDLLTDVLSPVERMLDFLKFPYNHTELIVRLADGFEDFRRNHTPHSSQIHYSPSQTMNINSMITETIQELKQHNLGSFGMEEYII